jgi:hypothetical protein
VWDQRERSARASRAIPAGRPHGRRDHVSGTARLLLAGEDEALTCKPVEMALAGDPTALRLCLERVVGPYHAWSSSRCCRSRAPARGRAAGRVPRQRNVTGRWGCGVEERYDFNQDGRFCYRFAAGAAIGNNRFN